MSWLSQIFLELLGWLAGETVADAAEQPVARSWRALRAYVSLPIVVAGWFGALFAMWVGWRLGVRHPDWWAQAVALSLWFGAPILAIVLTAAWFERRAV